jgi:hypothetical protein
MTLSVVDTIKRRETRKKRTTRLLKNQSEGGRVSFGGEDGSGFGGGRETMAGCDERRARED